MPKRISRNILLDKERGKISEDHVKWRTSTSYINQMDNKLGKMTKGKSAEGRETKVVPVVKNLRRNRP